MTGKELLSKVVLSLNTYLGFNDVDLIDLITIDENLDDGLTRLNALNPPANFIIFADTLLNIVRNNPSSFLTNPYNNLGTVNIINFNQSHFDKKNRSFAYSNTEFGFVSSKAFFDSNILIDFSKPEYSIVWKQIEDFLERCYSSMDSAKINQFFDIIANSDINHGLIINKTGQPLDERKHYSYIYLSFLNESNSIFLSHDLKYSTSSLSGNLILDGTKNYEQFFDLYDVINELNQSPDILNRYLHLYHILEYMIYRVYLVDLVNRIGSSKFFVREFIISAESMKKTEKASFLKNFKEIFTSDLVATITPGLNFVVSAHVTSFLTSKNIVKSFDTTNIAKVAELIYGLRCCIVHNKESEYHLTISNHEDYSIIVPLIRKLLEIFELLVIKKISVNHTTVNYPQESVNLY